MRSIELVAKSPRAPQLDLEAALEKALVLYEREQLAEVPLDVVAKNLGYKSANNGAAMSTFATLRYFGLVERSGPGKLRVAKGVRTYKYAPDAETCAALRRDWFMRPPLFAELLEKYPDGLPSDATVRFHLINDLGFRPGMAETVLNVFKKSSTFAPALDEEALDEEAAGEGLPEIVAADGNAGQVGDPPPMTAASTSHAAPIRPVPSSPSPSAQEIIPVRLSGGRRAWISLPEPFYEADKELLKRQIDLVLADEP